MQLNGMESWLRTQELLGEKSDAIPKVCDLLSLQSNVAHKAVTDLMTSTAWQFLESYHKDVLVTTRVLSWLPRTIRGHKHTINSCMATTWQ